MSKTFKNRLAIVVGTFGLAWGSIANAAPPANIVGNWTVVGNHHAGTLRITNQGGGVCAPINGTIYSGTFSGYYCPATGRIAFARKSTAGVVIQTWVGNVSDVGTPNRMGGTFHALDAAAGSGAFGEYHFQALK